MVDTCKHCGDVIFYLNEKWLHERSGRGIAMCGPGAATRAEPVEKQA